MAISLRVGRMKLGKTARTTGPSVREVCLLGGVRPSITEGERLTWSGRDYRVEATRAGYVHLTPERAGSM